MGADLRALNALLADTPTMGDLIGKNTYKIRLKIKSKGKGKSGGARVITHVESNIIADVESDGNLITVHLLTIYDKSDAETISDGELKKFTIAFHLNK